MALKRIQRDQLRLGMYVHAFDGSWFDHPFWRRGFLIQRESELAAVHGSGIDTLLIDTSKGSDIPAAAGAGASRKRPAQAEAHDPRTEAATQVVNRSKEKVRELFDAARLGKAVESSAVLSVVAEVASEIEHNRRALLRVLRLKSKDEYTYLHSVAVCALMVNLAAQIGLDERTAAKLGTAGLLHDVGKVKIPDEVLNKPGRLTDEEYALAKTHSIEGYRLLVQVEGIPPVALDVCQHHHEKMDGTGYPHGLNGEEISLAARMGAICDVYDALTSNRPYKNAWTPLEAITRMRQWQGHFDPQLLFAFMLSVGLLPVGTVVELRRERLGIVIEGGRRATRPKVLAFYSTRRRRFTRTELTVAGDGRFGDAILAEVDPAKWGIAQERIDHFVRLGVPWV
ncbi:HD-GYP domain-containing protein [Sphingosinicella terrae]|uniref:HD-GYP domain-containing protein n=1 Tax=Sphingosinicella terrae TaxID=2172047 RepID=UPI000E0DCAEB|nr:HD-GYP domain-containing protein [Sphingosinicella terrae]